MTLPSPAEIRLLYPISSQKASFLEASRQTARAIVEKKSPRFTLLVGPCSVHDLDSTLEYGQKLATLSKELEVIFPIMRVFLEKPRTSVGWKGILQDPYLDGSYRIEEGLKMARQVLWELLEMNIPCATEFLDPMTAPYFDDCITWGVIGARTSSSQVHRQLASFLPFPVGFKNDLHGEIDTALGGIIASHMPHRRIGINEDGRMSALDAKGNPWAHLVLRGSQDRANYDPASVVRALHALEAHHLPPLLCIDCSHGNSQKQHALQRVAFQSVIEQRVKGNHAIIGAMLESHLFEGRQSLKLKEQPRYGVSVTDSCMGWEETKSLIVWADQSLKKAPLHLNELFQAT